MIGRATPTGLRGRGHRVRAVASNALKGVGIDPAAERSCTTWSTFLRSEAERATGLRFLRDPPLTDARLYVLAVIEQPAAESEYSAPLRTQPPLGHQAIMNLVMDLDDADSSTRFMVRDRDGRYRALFDDISPTQTSGSFSAVSGVTADRHDRELRPNISTRTARPHVDSGITGTPFRGRTPAFITTPDRVESSVHTDRRSGAVAGPDGGRGLAGSGGAPSGPPRPATPVRCRGRTVVPGATTPPPTPHSLPAAATPRQPRPAPRRHTRPAIATARLARSVAPGSPTR